MKKSKALSLLLASAMLLGTLAGCSGGTNDAPKNSNTPTESTPVSSNAPTADNAGGPLDLNVCVASEPQTLDPNLNQSLDGGMLFAHLFEGLYRYEDDGTGNAVLKLGLAAEEPTVVENPQEDGTSTYTYTFKLRQDAKWSDGEPVKASDIVYSWQRLVNPETAAAYNYMLNMVVNANEIMAGDLPVSDLAISAPDDYTFVAELTYNCPYFTDVCAFATCVPLREDIISANPSNWTTGDESGYVCNGPYKLGEWSHNAYIKMVRNENYYDPSRQGPESITWKLMDDTQAMLTAFDNGELDFFLNAPVDEIATLLAEGKLVPSDQIATYYACFNNSKPPFDNPDVRRAFSLVIDRNYIVEKVTQVGEAPAAGFVPYTVPDAEGVTGTDFRTKGGDYFSLAPEDYEKNCEEARELMAKAGYADGVGFPQITYLYNTDNRHNAIAEALQQMWKTQLGVEIKLDNQDWNVFMDTRNKGEFDICRHGWTADYNDPLTMLDIFLSENIGGNNNAYFDNEQYDTLIKTVQHESDPELRMQMMHDAEKILIQDSAAIAPIFFYTQPYVINENADGMFYTPLGYYFFYNCK